MLRRYGNMRPARMESCPSLATCLGFSNPMSPKARHGAPNHFGVGRTGPPANLERIERKGNTCRYSIRGDSLWSHSSGYCRSAGFQSAVDLQACPAPVVRVSRPQRISSTRFSTLSHDSLRCSVLIRKPNARSIQNDQLQ